MIKDGNVLLGKRKNSHGHGSYGSGGGHLEFMESFEDAVKREIFEEAGIEIDNLKFLGVSNFAVDGKHYVDISFSADWKSGEPTVKEPEKLESWEWYDIDNPPSPLFGVVANYFEALKTGQHYFDF